MGLGVDAALVSGPGQDLVHVRVGELGGHAGSKGGGKLRAGFRARDAAALGGERGQQGRVVLAQQGAQLVVRAGALSQRVLLSAGEHRNAEFGVRGQRVEAVNTRGAGESGHARRQAPSGS